MFAAESSGSADTEWVLYARLPAWRNPYTLFLGFVALLMAAMCGMLLVSAPSSEWFIALAFSAAATPWILYFWWSGVWSYCGREEIAVVDGALLLRKRVCGVPWVSRQYEALRIRSLRVRECGKLPWRPSNAFVMDRELGFGDGPVTFDYDGSEVRIAEALRDDPVAAEELAERLRVGLGLDV